MADRPLTESEQALLHYFHVVSKRPEILSALPDPKKVALAFASCIERDVPAVLRHAFGRGVGKIEMPARFMARAVVDSVLVGAVPEKARGHAADMVDALAGDAFKYLGDLIAGRNDKDKGKRR